MIRDLCGGSRTGGIILPELGSTRKQQKEGDNKVAYSQKYGYVLPTMVPSMGKPDRFLRNISVPDQHELREGDVSPEDVEGEQQLAEIVEAIHGQPFADQSRGTGK